MIILNEPVELDTIKQIVRDSFPFRTDKLGKFIRSKIGLLILKTSDIDRTQRHLDFLSAIELIHNASLMHDDVIDDERIRRGETCIKERFNNKISILYGNLLITKSLRIINDIHSIKLSNIILSAIDDMCRGELIQQEQLGTIPNLKDYLIKTELKTATLFKVMVSGLMELEPAKINPCFWEFAKNYGIGFQIKNDLDNVLKTNSDKENGIYTAPYIFSQNKNLSDNSLEKTVSLIDNYISKSIVSLSELRESKGKAELVGVAKCLKD